MHPLGTLEAPRAGTAAAVPVDVVFEKDSHGIDFYVLVQGTILIDDGEDVHVEVSGRTLLVEAHLPGEPPGQQSESNKLRYLWCLPPFTPMCLRMGGQIVSMAKLDPQKARVLGVCCLKLSCGN